MAVFSSSSHGFPHQNTCVSWDQLRPPGNSPRVAHIANAWKDGLMDRWIDGWRNFGAEKSHYILQL